MIDLKNIYLIDTGHAVVWCDTPKPAYDVRAADVTEYVRADVADSQTQQISELKAELQQLQEINRTLHADRAFINQKQPELLTDYAEWRMQFQRSEQAAKAGFSAANMAIKELEKYIEVKNGN